MTRLAYVEYHGVRMTVRELIERSVYERTEAQLCADLLDGSEGPVIVAGVGMGLIAAVAAATVGGVDRVVGYEPYPMLAQTVEQNVRVAMVDGEGGAIPPEPLTVAPAALTVNGGAVNLTPGGEWATSTVSRGPLTDVTVLSVPLADVVADTDARALILDVEGYEYRLLDDPSRIDGLNRLMIEMHHTDSGEWGPMLAGLGDAGWWVDRSVLRDGEDTALVTMRRR